MNPGSWLIRLAAFSTVLAFVFGIRWARGHGPSEKLFRRAYDAMALLLGFASVALMTAILRHDFRYEYVTHYSSRDLPMLYLVSAFWGGQEGTYLLWAVFATAIGYWLLYRESWQRPTVMTAYVGTIGLLNLLMLHPNADPFRLGATVPADGNGLNPLLQDPWMAAHPPVVFLGYAALAVPAILALVAVWKRDETKWIVPGLRFALFGFITLGIGIVMGAFWAYKVLGWGGFWGWDPVENASLVPWLVVTALVHGLLVQQMTGSLRLSNVLLAMGGYLTTVYATFLTRSGVLADFSVHSFPKGTVYSWLVAGMTTVVAVFAVTLLRRRNQTTPRLTGGFTWPLILASAMGLLTVSTFLVLLGTSWPIISSWFGKPGTPNAGFYNEVNLPIYILLGVLLGIGPFLTWLPIAPARWLKRFAPSVVIAAVMTVLAVMMGAHGVGSLLLFFAATMALVSNVIRFAHLAPHRLLTTGAAVAHIGFALVLIGIIASEGWDASERIRLPIGESTRVLDRTVTYLGHVDGTEGKDRWSLEVGEAGNARKVETTFYSLPNRQSFRKPAIVREALGDLYIAPEEVGSGSEASRLELVKGEAQDFGGATLTFQRFNMGDGSHEGMSLTAEVEIAKDGKSELLNLPLHFDGGTLEGDAIESEVAGGLSLALAGMSVEQGMIRVDVAGSGGAQAESMLLEVSRKPLIGLLWFGTFMIFAGCGIALARRSVDRLLDETMAVHQAKGVQGNQEKLRPRPIAG